MSYAHMHGSQRQTVQYFIKKKIGIEWKNQIGTIYQMPRRHDKANKKYQSLHKMCIEFPLNNVLCNFSAYKYILHARILILNIYFPLHCYLVGNKIKDIGSW